MFSGMLDVKKTQVQLKSLKRYAGFLKPLDDAFAAYYEGYLKIVGQHARKLELVFPGADEDTGMTLYQSIMAKFRRKLKEALQRLHGFEPIPLIPQTDIEDLLRR